MTHSKRGKSLAGFAAVLLVACVTMVLGCRGSSYPGGSVLPPASPVNAFVKLAQESGFAVREGQLKYIDVFALTDKGDLPNCFGNNANNPYLSYSFEAPFPGQVLPEGALLTETQFQLREDEALVLFGKTPPPMRYYGYRSYLYSRYYDPLTGEPQIPGTSGAGYARVFATLGDTINLNTVKAGSTYRSDIIVITTADSAVDQRIRILAQLAGFPSSIINTDIIPRDVTHMGLGPQKDIFCFLHRTALFDNDDECLEFVKNPGGRLFRLTPASPGASESFPMPALRPQGTGVREGDDQSLRDALDDLEQKIVAAYPGLKAEPLQVQPISRDFLMYEAIANQHNALGDNRDATYLRVVTPFKLALDDDEFVIVYGVNHARTNKASYCSVTVRGDQYLNGVGGPDSRSYEGTAQYYSPLNARAPDLYAYKIARRAAGHPNCFEVPFDALKPNDGSSSTINLASSMKLVFRAYLEPATLVGPLPEEILMDRAIRFSRN